MTRARDVANIDGILTTTGDTYYASAAATPTRLGVGSTGQVLTVAGGVPTWATPAGGGKIAQVVSATISTSTSSTSTTFVDATNFNLSITPTNASSKVLVMIMACMGGSYSGDNSGQFDIQLVRGSTSILAPNRNNWYENGTSDSKVFRTTVPLTYLDSPATTSATTYKLQIRNQFGGSVYVNSNSNISTITLMEVLP